MYLSLKFLKIIDISGKIWYYYSKFVNIKRHKFKSKWKESAMENFFSLNDVKISHGDPISLSGQGMFFWCQISSFSDVLCNGNQLKTVSYGETFAGNLEKNYTLVPNNENNCFAILISVNGEFVKNITQEYNISDGFLVKAPEVPENIEEMREIFESNRYSEEEKKARTALLFHGLIYKLYKAATSRLVRRTALRIKDYIDSHIEEKIELKTLSEVFFMSKTQLFRIFKEEYGVAPIKYLTIRKIELSKKLLKNGNLKISEISDSLSFFDAKHFSKTFLKYEGILPSKYRKKT